MESYSSLCRSAQHTIGATLEARVAVDLLHSVLCAAMIAQDLRTTHRAFVEYVPAPHFSSWEKRPASSLPGAGLEQPARVTPEGRILFDQCAGISRPLHVMRIPSVRLSLLRQGCASKGFRDARSILFEALRSARTDLLSAVVDEWRGVGAVTAPAINDDAGNIVHEFPEVGDVFRHGDGSCTLICTCVYLNISRCSLSIVHVPHHACADLATNPSRALLVLDRLSPRHHQSLSSAGTPWGAVRLASPCRPFRKAPIH